MNITMTTQPEQTGPPKTNSAPKNNRKTKWIIAASITGFVAIAIACGVYITSGTNNIEDTARDECQSVVADGLKYPSTATFNGVNTSKGGDFVVSDLPDRFAGLSDVSAYVVAGNVDSQNSYGAIVRSKFNCRAVFDGENFVGSELRFIEPN